MTKLSVNINKIATLQKRKRREMYQICLRLLPIFKYGGQESMIHQRPDEHHIRYQDARDLKTWCIPNLILKEIRSIIL
jgi:pyridoxine 5-phosphate synthase